jgi:hypothetical protein
MRNFLFAVLGFCIGAAVAYFVVTRSAHTERRRTVAVQRSLWTKYNAISPPNVQDTSARSAQPCSSDPAEWLTWREGQIKAMLEPTYQNGDERLIDRDQVIAKSASAFERLDDCMRQLPELFAAESDLGRQFDRFYRFIRAVHWMNIKDQAGKPLHQMGARIPDKEYWEYAKPYVEVPEFMRQTAFLKAMDSPAGYRDGVRMIEEHNSTLLEDQRWDVLPFRAQFITTVDVVPADSPESHRTYGRLLVVVPNVPAQGGGTIDKWVLWGIVTPDMNQNTKMNNVSVIATHRSPFGVADTYFMDFWRQRSGAGDIELVSTMLIDKDPSKNCYDCHKIPTLPIYPKTEYAFDQTGKLIPKAGFAHSKTINQRIPEYGPPHLGVIEAFDYGPALGPVNRPRSDEFIKTCSGNSGLSEGSIQRVRSKMNCATCHSASYLGPINYLQAVRNKRDVTAFELKESMITTFVTNGYMPPNSTLTIDERRALALCLSAEYHDLKSGTGVLQEWLAGK